MTKPIEKTVLHALAERWELQRRWQYAVCLFVPVVLGVTVTGVWATEYTAWLVVAFAVLCSAVGYGALIRLQPVTPEAVAAHLNRALPELEESAQLLLLPDAGLPLVRAMQHDRVTRVFARSPPSTPVWVDKILFVSMGVLLLVLMGGATLITTHTRATQRSLVKSKKEDTKEALRITKVQVEVNPPAYTRQAKYGQPQLDVSAPTGAVVSWTLEVSGSPDSVMVEMNTGLRIPLHKTKGQAWQVNYTLAQSGYYSVKLVRDTAKHYEGPHALAALADQPPQVELTAPETSQEIRYSTNMRLPLRAKLHDDYGLTSCVAVLTVARGKGEGVRFEQKQLTLPISLAHAPQHAQVQTVLALDAFKLAPGDELYGYLLVKDNRIPLANEKKSEVWFVQIEDTAAQPSELSLGLGVNRIPAYFRSQRQIIIDTEKLIGKRASLAKDIFMASSNTIAIDQKVLRLRYGQFLGEEYEETLISTEHTAGGHDRGDHDEEEHDHDNDGKADHKANEHKHTADDGHDHSHDNGGAAAQGGMTGDARSVVAQFGHMHDTAEEATYFPEAVKAQLKAALAEMWRAELHLRLGEPELALPFEEKALRLLKAVQQSSRAYVRKVGFELPPLKLEKRLTGELDKVKPQTQTQEMRAEDVQAALRNMVIVLQRASKLTAAEQAVLTVGGQALAQLAPEQPARYLPALRALRKLLDEAAKGATCVPCSMQVLQVLHRTLTPLPASAAERSGADDALAKLYHNNLNKNP